MNKKRIDLKSKSIILQLLIIYILIKGIHCLKMKGLKIPNYIFEGQPAELHCQFSMGQEILYSVKWYKDHEEFFRYVPKNKPEQQAFRLEGAKIDKLGSGKNIVKLKAATPAASGVYRCEVSGEAPSFTSVNAEGYMVVVSLPIEGPEITGKPYSRDYREGDILALNCSAGKSYPPAEIKWFVNDKQVPAWYETQGSLENSTSSELRLRLSSSHLAQDFLVVKCVATVGSSPPPIQETLLDTRESKFFVRGSAAINKSSRFAMALNIILFYIIKLKKYFA